MQLQSGLSQPRAGSAFAHPHFAQTSKQFPLKEDRFKAFHYNGQTYRDWSDIPWRPFKRPNPFVYHGIVETPMGARKKLEVNREDGMWYQDAKNGERRVNLVPAPADYGFIPQTLSPDRDPVDMFVLQHKPKTVEHDESLDKLHPRAGEVKQVELIGALLVEDGDELDPKVIAEEVGNTQYRDISQLRPTDPEWANLEDLKLFLKTYKPNAEKDMQFPRLHWVSKEQAQTMVENYHQEWEQYVKEHPRPGLS